MGTKPVVFGMGCIAVEYSELAADPAMLARAFVGHMARYATGTDLSYADRRAVDEIVAAAAPTQYGVRSLIHAIAASPLLRGTR